MNAITQTDALADIGAERAFLQFVLSSQGGALAARGGLEPEDFFDPTLGVVFAEMLAIAERAEPVTVIAVKHVLDSVRTPEGQTARDYMNDNAVSGVYPDPMALAAHIKNLAVRRELAKLGRDIRLEALDVNVAIPDLAAAVRTRLNDTLSGHMAADKPASFATHLDSLHAYLESQSDPMLKTGIGAFDRSFGGLFEHDFVLLAGRPSMGKSAVAHDVALNVALRGQGVLIISLEMPGRDVVARMISSLMARVGHRFPYSSILKREELPLAIHEEFYRTSDSYRRLPIIIHEVGEGADLLSINAHVQSAKKEFGSYGIPLKLIVIDHIGLMKVSNRYRGNRVNEVAELSTGLATLARTEKITTLTLCQLNRQVEQREGKWPELSDLRDSGSLEQDASAVVMVFRPAYYLEKELESLRGDEAGNALKIADVEAALHLYRNTLKLNVPKFRNGETRTISCEIDIACNRVV